jgi:hypothetical protein
MGEKPESGKGLTRNRPVHIHSFTCINSHLHVAWDCIFEMAEMEEGQDMEKEEKKARPYGKRYSRTP